jgi:hypothetical protein
MRVARVKVSAGKAAEFNADGHGYAPSGESEYSRVAAHGGNGARRDPNAPRERLNGFMPADEKIRRAQIEIGNLEGQLKFERDPTKRAKLEKNLKIKNALLGEYGRERNDPTYIREKIRV